MTTNTRANLASKAARQYASERREAVSVYSGEDLERQQAVDRAQEKVRLLTRHAGRIREDLEYRALRLREALGAHTAAPILGTVDDLLHLQHEADDAVIAIGEVA